jgi:aspartate aminotransferase
MQISKRVQNIAASQSLATAARAKAMQAAGIDVISMSLGEPDMDTPEHVRRAAQEAIDNHWSHYGPVAGLPALRTAVAAYHNQAASNKIAWEAQDTIVSVGAKMAIYNAIQTVINPGDEVIIPQPSWVSYTEMVKLAEGLAIPVQTRYEDNYCLTPEQLRATLTDKTRMIILCSPNNPTGSVYSAAQFEALVAVLRDYPEVVILSDEIYSCLTYDCEAPSLASFPELAERLIVINGVSKAFAMTGYRIGWLLTKNKAFIEACIRLQGQQLTCATIIAQKAAEAALTGSQECVEQMRQVFAQRRELICRLAEEIPGFRFNKPQGAFYLFPDVRAIGSGDEVAAMLLDKAHVAVVSGSAFGCPECIRLSYAISTQEIEEAMRRIQKAINK